MNTVDKITLTRACIQELKNHLIAPEEVAEGESCPAAKAEIVNKYREKVNDVLVTLNHVMENAPVYKNRKGDKSLENDILFCRLAYGFQPDEYLFYGLENKKKEDREEWISDIDRYIFIRLMNDIEDVGVFDHKARTYEMFHKYYGRKMISIKEETDFEKFSAFVSDRTSFVKKKADESMGRTVELVRTGDISAREYFENLIAQGEHVIEEKIRQNDVMAGFNPSSVNTVRCITIKTREAVKMPYSILKTGRKGTFTDNAHVGGIMAGIDADSGMIITNGRDSYASEFECHPDSGKRFRGCVLPCWNELKEMCRDMAEMVPGVKCIGWDVALTDQGWIVVEGNGSTQLIGPQIVFNRGFKREFTDILEHVDLII